MSDESNRNKEVIAHIGAQMEDVFVTFLQLAHQSCQFGSEVTGAPGQAVRTGTLRNSVMLERTGPDSATISSNIIYAEPMEEGIGAHGQLTLRSSVGGFHSFKLTAANADRLVVQAKEVVLRRGAA